MSFAASVKSELCDIKIMSDNAKKAQLYAMILFGRIFDKQTISLQSENIKIINTFCLLTSDLYGIVPEITEQNIKNKRNKIYYASVYDGEDIDILLNEFENKSDINHRINRDFLSDDTTISAFLRGAYLICGSVTDPTKSYHFEFNIPFLLLSQDLISIVNELGFLFKCSKRKGNYVIYIKESENIEDVLTYMGASKASLELMNIKIFKDLRNKVNRVTNCETANIEKTINAATVQVEDINFIVNTKGISCLSDELQELALLRMDNPEMSLRELGELLNPPLSRSGVNHRLKRISEIANRLR